MANEDAPRRRRRAAAETTEAPEAPETPTAAVTGEGGGPSRVTLYDAGGIRAGEAELPASIFGQTPNMAVMHQAFVRQRNNGRQGTASTKTRSQVRGGGAKPYRQKGTGRARHGSVREPSMVGGGTVFGPQPHSYAQRMPRKMRRLALRSALSVKAGEGAVSVIEGFSLEEPKTRAMVELFRGLGVAETETALLVLPAQNDVISRSVSNLPWATVVLAHNLNLYDLFTHDRLVIAKDALGLLEESLSS